MALYLGRVDTVYCGVDRDLLLHYRDFMLRETRISSGHLKTTDQKPTRNEVV